MKLNNTLRIVILLVLPVLVYFGITLSLNKYFFDEYFYTGPKASNLQIVERVASLDGFMPVFFSESERKLIIGSYMKKQSQDYLKNVIWDVDSKPYSVETLGQKLSKKFGTQAKNNFGNPLNYYRLPYKEVSQDDFVYINDFYSSHSPYLLKKLTADSKENYNGGHIYVLRNKDNEKIYAVTMSVRWGNDIGTSELVIFNKNKQIISQNYYNEDVDDGMTNLSILLLQVISLPPILLAESVYIYTHWFAKKKKKK